MARQTHTHTPLDPDAGAVAQTTATPRTAQFDALTAAAKLQHAPVLQLFDCTQSTCRSNLSHSVRRCGNPTTWTILHKDGPNHLGLRYGQLVTLGALLTCSFGETGRREGQADPPPAEEARVDRLRTLPPDLCAEPGPAQREMRMERTAPHPS